MTATVTTQTSPPQVPAAKKTVLPPLTERRRKLPAAVAVSTTARLLGAATRKPRPAGPNDQAMLVGLNAAGRNGVVCIAIAGKSQNYFLDRIPSDFGQAFNVEKIGQG